MRATRLCGTVPVALTADAEGRVSGSVTFPDGSPNCGTSAFSASGRVAGDTIDLVLNGMGIRALGTLRKGVVPAAIASVPQTPDAPQVPAPARPLAYGGNLIFNLSSQPGTVIAATTLEVSGATAKGQVVTRLCGSFPIALAVAADGTLSGSVNLPAGRRDQGCTTSPFSANGKVAGEAFELTLQGAGARGTGTLRKGVIPPEPANTDQASGAPTAAVPGASAVPPAIATATSYRGSLSSPAIGTSGSFAFTADFKVIGGRLTGQVSERRCGSYAIDLPVSASGEFGGEAKFMEDVNCSPSVAKVGGRVGADTLVIEIRTLRMTASGTLRVAR